MLQKPKVFTAIIVLLCTHLIFVGVKLADAGTYWVSPNGAATWANCISETPLAGTAACSLGTANTNAAAGDTIYLRGGNYTTSFSTNVSGTPSVDYVFIAPVNSGSSYNNRIVFSGYSDETVTFIGDRYNVTAVYLSGKQWVHITKINARYCQRHLIITNSHRCEVSHSTFAYQYDNNNGMDWVGSRVRTGATYNHVHDCVFRDYGYFDPNDVAVVFGVGLEGIQDNTQYNLIENNQFYHGGHHVIEFNGSYNVWRNNYIRNNAWYNYGGTLYGNRVFFSYGQWSQNIGRNLLEYNKVAYGGECADSEIGGSGGSLVSDYNIIRRNMFYQNYLHGFVAKPYDITSNYNQIYHNVFWYNGWSSTGPSKGNWNWIYSHGLLFEESSSVRDNAVKNNIFHQNRNYYSATGPIIETDATVPDLQEISGNWMDTGDPKFVNISGTPDPTNPTQFNFNLQSDSPAINQGVFLTTITSANGSGTSFTVANAGYFFDGWGMAANIPSATISGDVIQLQGQTATATITNVNYSTNTITFSPSLTWTQGQGVALAYNGSAPDQGAFEYVSSGPPPPPDTESPTVPTNLAANAISSSQINLSWTASTDNVGVTGYRIYRCQGTTCTPTTQIATSSTNSYQDTGLAASTTYRYRVQAHDAAGNLSSYSSTVTATTQAPPPLGSNLIAAYSFNEGSGTIVSDSSGNSNNGILVNGPIWTTGKYGNALSFDGVNDRVDTKNFMSSQVTSFTLHAWVYKTATKDARIIYKNNAGNIGHPVFGLASGSDNAIRCRLRASDGTGVDYSAGSISLNTWTHVACTYDGSNVRVYKDGVQVGSTSKTGTLAATNDVAVIGQNEAGTSVDRHWPGRIDEVRIYNRALSQSEIQQDMNTPIGGGSVPDTPPAPPTGFGIQPM